MMPSRMRADSTPHPAPTVLLVGLWADDPFSFLPQRFGHLDAHCASLGLGFAWVHRHQGAAALATWKTKPLAGIVLSGSKHNLGEDVAVSDFADVLALLEAMPQVPVYGICFGHQLLAAAYGGSLGYVKPRRDTGDWPIEPANGGHAIFRSVPQPMLLPEYHGMVVTDPPPGWRVFARSSDGIEGIAHPTLPRIGTQFHPEYHPDSKSGHGRIVLDNWLRSLG